MKEIFKFRNILCWLICIGAYWVSAALYPYNFYYQETYIPEMTFLQILTLAGITAILGTVMHFLLLGLCALGGWIGMKKNLILYFLYEFIFCSLFAFASDWVLDFIKIEPIQLYLLLGFFPAMLCSIVYSYHVSHKKIQEKQANEK